MYLVLNMKSFRPTPSLRGRGGGQRAKEKQKQANKQKLFPLWIPIQFLFSIWLFLFDAVKCVFISKFCQNIYQNFKFAVSGQPTGAGDLPAILLSEWIFLLFESVLIPFLLHSSSKSKTKEKENPMNWENNKGRWRKKFESMENGIRCSPLFRDTFILTFDGDW